MRPTIRQVAQRAQVSPMTVSNVLRQPDLVAPDTRERVLKILRELNYVPVQSAVQNRHVATRTLSLVLYHPDSAMPALDLQTYEGLCQGAAEHGYDLLTILRSQPDWFPDREELRFLDRRSDGAIFLSSMSGEWQSSFEALRSEKIPAVVCYRRDVPEGIAWIDADNAQIMRLAIEYLKDKGHRKIAHLAGPEKQFDAVMREREFGNALRDNGLEFSSSHVTRGILPGWKWDEDAAKKLLQSGATAIVCFNDDLALWLWQIAEKLGLQVPRDISILGIDNTVHAQYRGLTSIEYSFHAVGRAAVESWICLNNGGDWKSCCREMPGTLHERNSVGELK
jgi:DNA-binding LacI/PurR family transcriptional regulator